MDIPSFLLNCGGSPRWARSFAAKAAGREGFALPRASYFLSDQKVTKESPGVATIGPRRTKPPGPPCCPRPGPPFTGDEQGSLSVQSGAEVLTNCSINCAAAADAVRHCAMFRWNGKRLVLSKFDRQYGLPPAPSAHQLCGLKVGALESRAPGAVKNYTTLFLDIPFQYRTRFRLFY
jgi:hypothetical protein